MIKISKIIEVTDLYKSYGDIRAVKGISFYVETGSLFAFLGPNGAGKSTTIDMISTLLKPDSGSIVIDGYSIGKSDDQIRSRIGIVFQDSLLDPLLTVRENLSARGTFYKLSNAALKEAINRAARITGIAEFVNQPYGKLSGGQRRRADIARALINTPRILILDEPTTGLDPQTRRSVWETIQQLQKEENMTVFLTTHYMEEAAMADYIKIIDHGEILARGTPAQLKDAYSTDILKITPKDPAALAATLDRESIMFTINNDVFEVVLKHTVEALPIINKCTGNIDNIELINGTMDEVFINITGVEVRD